METILPYALKNMALMGLFFGVYRWWLYHRKNFKYNRFFLLGGLLVSFIAPLISITKTISVPWRAPMVYAKQVAVVYTVPEDQYENWLWMGLVGISGTLFLLLLFRLGMVINILIHSKVVAKKPKVLVCKRSKAPFSFLQNIVFPKALYLGPNYETILTHEKIHVKQAHSLDVLLVNFALVFGWWNPLLWWYKKYLIENLEFLTDHLTVAKTQQTKAYQYILLHQSIPEENLALVHPFYHSFLKKRIMMLNNTTIKKSPWASLILLPLTIAFVFIFNTKIIAQIAPPPPPTPASTIVPPKPPVQLQDTLGFKSSVSVRITSQSSREEIKKSFSELFSEMGVSLSFKGVKRNNKGEIVKLKATYKTNNGKTGTYAVSGNTPISPFSFYINMEENEKIVSAGFRQDPNNASYKTAVKKQRRNAKNLKMSVKSLKEAEKALEIAVETLENLEGEIEKNTSEITHKVVVANRDGEILTEKIYGGNKDTLLIIKNKDGEILTEDILESKKKKLNKIIFHDFKMGKNGEKEIIVYKKGNKRNAAIFINGTAVNTDSMVAFEYESVSDISLDIVKPDSISVSLGGIKAGKNGILVIHTDQNKNKNHKEVTEGSGFWLPEPSKNKDKNSYKVVVKEKDKGNIVGVRAQPLIVLNGKVLPKGEKLNSINHKEIKSISVLKGKAATKIYGAKASDGVILITSEKE